MLTEKECREALKDLYNSICELEEIKSGVETTCVFDDSLDCFKELIDQHFDNPPLKFEELKEGMWIWDNKYKYYFECNPRISTDMAECVWYESFWYNTGEGYDEFYEDYIEFEENRFYRKEVQE